MKDTRPLTGTGLLILIPLMLSGCLGGDGSSSRSMPEAGKPPEQQTRLQDKRQFVPAEDISFEARPGTTAYYGIYEGIQGAAVYAVEIPDYWDGYGLIMYTHGSRGGSPILNLELPEEPWRDAVLAAGYAWASSSYSANFYDVRAGIEDTNKLALNLMDYLRADWGADYQQPSQYLISGTSMGGHVAAAAVERENRERTAFPVDYAGAAPFCHSDQNEFVWLIDYGKVVQELSGYGHLNPAEFAPLIGDFGDTGLILESPGAAITALFELKQNGAPDWASPVSPNGERLMGIVESLTGGRRPFFEEGFASQFKDLVLAMNRAGGMETLEGVLGSNHYDNQDRIYRWTKGPFPTVAERQFNQRIERISAAPDANPLRTDGVRWLPLISGDFDVPVMTMHTLGDFLVPFGNQQTYRKNAIDRGSDGLLVQRAVRAPGHCDFSAQEITRAITDWLGWVNGGAKPEGDGVQDPVQIADPAYGCTFTEPLRPGDSGCPTG